VQLFRFRASKQIESILQLTDLKKEGDGGLFHFEITARLIDAELSPDSIVCLCSHCDCPIPTAEICVAKVGTCSSCSNDWNPEEVCCTSTVVATFEDERNELFDALLPSSVMNFLPDLTGSMMKREMSQDGGLFKEHRLHFCFSIFRLILGCNQQRITVYGATRPTPLN
jgi:hypothetical protein